MWLVEMNENRKNCPMRHANGNCLPCGGFCLAVNDEICEALWQAYRHGWSDSCNVVPMYKESEV